MAIGRTNAGAGGSGGVNFKVVGGTTEPASPKENTIWVNTDMDITSWAFSATEPESPVAGMVWISTSTSSTVEFNALKKNAIQVYPISAKQYVGGEWVRKNASFFQSGKWVLFSTPIPNDYQPVEYLESTGTQYLNTPFKPDETDTFAHEVKFTKTATQDEAYLMGTGATSASGDSARYNLQVNGGGEEMWWNIGPTTETLVGPMITNNIIYTAITTISPDSISMKVNGTQYGPESCQVVEPTATVDLFGRANNKNNTIANAKVAKCRIYYWKIYDENGLVHNFEPCYRKSGSVAGMYDGVTSTFLTNAGTGTFVVGGDI